MAMNRQTIAYKCLKKAISRGDAPGFEKWFGAVNGKLPEGVTKSALEKAVECHRTEFVTRLAPLEALLCKDEVDVLEIIYPQLLVAAVEAEDYPAVKKWSWLANRNARDRDTALMVAAATGKAQAFELLIYLERERTGAQGRTVLHAAAEGGDMQALRRAIADDDTTGRPLVGRADRTGRTALMTAATAGHGECAAFLIAHAPAELRKVSNYGETALMLAAKGGFVEIVTKLVSAGEANVVANGKTALTYAIEAKNEDIAVLLCASEGYTDTTPSNLLLALDLGLLAVARALLPYQAHTHLSDPRVRELTMKAVSSKEMQNAVENRDANLVLDIFSRTNSYATQLITAVIADDVNAVAAALPLVGACPPGHRSALQTAAEHGRADIARILARESGRADANGLTALMEASMSGAPIVQTKRIIEMLFPNEAGMHDQKGRTALMMAVSARNVSAIKTLAELDLASATDVANCRELGKADNFGMTALMYIAAIGDANLNQCIASLLPEARLVDAKGRSAADHALARGNEAFAEELHRLRQLKKSRRVDAE